MTLRSAARLRIARSDLREAVLGRVVAALAAQVDLPIDRVSDAQLIGAALVAAADRRGAGSLEVELLTAERCVELRVGPLPAGAGGALVADSALPGVGVVLERLVDGWRVEGDGNGSETLALTIGGT